MMLGSDQASAYTSISLLSTFLYSLQHIKHICSSRSRIHKYTAARRNFAALACCGKKI